jgi:hypothetical protein
MHFQPIFWPGTPHAPAIAWDRLRRLRSFSQLRAAAPALGWFCRLDLFVIDTCQRPQAGANSPLVRGLSRFDRKSKEAGKPIILLEKMPPAGQSDAASLKALNQVVRNLNQNLQNLNQKVK